MVIVSFMRQAGLCMAALGANARICRVEGISASRARVALALACGLILAVTRVGVVDPGRAPGGRAARRDASGSAAAAGRDQGCRRAAWRPGGAVCMAAVSSSRVAWCSRGRRGVKAPVMVPVRCFPGPAGTIRPGGGGCRSGHGSAA